MNPPTLLQLLSQSTALPSIPRVVALVLKELELDEPDSRKIAKLLATDPMLVGRMLKMANSAFFGSSREIASVDGALAVLGISQIRTLVTAVALGNSFRHVPGVELEAFWRYSLNSAKLARPLAKSLGVNDGTAFTAALLHAIGELVLCTALPGVTASLPGSMFALDRVQTEQAVLGYSFVEVSGAFARQWEFPAAISRSLERQEEPGVDEDFDAVAGVVHMASWRARTIELQLTMHEMALSFPHAVGEALNLDMERVLCNEPDEWTSLRDLSLFLD